MLDGKVPDVVVPVGTWIFVRKIRKTITAGGIHLVQAFKAGKHGSSAREKMNAVPDYFEAVVLATGPEVRTSEAAGLEQGDRCLVWSYAEGDGSRLYTGEDVGMRDHLFIRPSDVVCAIDDDEAAE